jgi:hypothetical protein
MLFKVLFVDLMDNFALTSALLGFRLALQTSVQLMITT